jgi:micrococcal nuclease
MTVKFTPREFPVFSAKAIDGDTIEATIDIGFRLTITERFRVLYVNTPERGEDGYVDATGFTKDWLLTHEDSIVVWCIGRDKYGRWLAEVRDRNTTPPASLGQALLDAGHAVPYQGASK